MTAVDPNFSEDAAREARKEKLFTRINKADRWFQVLGLSWMTPVLKAAAGDNPQAQISEIWRLLGIPLLAIAGFLMLWATLAPTVQTSLGAIPGPSQVWTEVVKRTLDAGKELTGDNMAESLASIEDWDTGGIIGIPVTVRNMSFPVGRIWRVNAEEGRYEPVSDWIHLD